MHKLVVLLFTLVVGAPLWAEEPENVDAVEADAGFIRALDFENNTMVVGGWQYAVPLDTPVTIRGGNSAFTLLTVGMKAEVTFRFTESGRVALAVDQLPDNKIIEEF
ncbi:MAG: hypothetical protein H6994_09205 [Pseudomonadales bacterium]|nr:hypothetical protein [Pseudomonadales bacterium]